MCRGIYTQHWRCSGNEPWAVLDLQNPPPCQQEVLLVPPVLGWWILTFSSSWLLLLALYHSRFWQEMKGTRKESKKTFIKSLFIKVLAELGKPIWCWGSLAKLGNITILAWKAKGTIGSLTLWSTVRGEEMLPGLPWSCVGRYSQPAVSRQQGSHRANMPFLLFPWDPCSPDASVGSIYWEPEGKVVQGYFAQRSASA